MDSLKAQLPPLALHEMSLAVFTVLYFNRVWLASGKGNMTVTFLLPGEPTQSAIEK